MRRCEPSPDEDQPRTDALEEGTCENSPKEDAVAAPPILILHSPGTNRDAEAALAVKLAGGDPSIVSMNDLRAGAASMSGFAALVLPGGFSYGDALGAGARLALELRTWLYEELAGAVRSGRPVLGICNGFQALLKSGLFGEPGAPRRVTLTDNANGRFECRWVNLRVEPGCRSGWLRAIEGTLIRCPVAHGEGRVAVTDPEVVRVLEEERLVAFRYLSEDSHAGAEQVAGGRYPANPNGSVADIAGLCDPTGTAVGLMPHPEDHVVDWQRPGGPPGGLGLAIFEAFVDAAR